MVFFYVAGYLSDGVDWSLDQIEDLCIAYRPIQMFLSMIWISVVGVHNNMDANVQEIAKYFSQEAIQCSLKYEVGYILDSFLCHLCGIFKGLDQPQEVEFISTSKFAASLGLVNIIRKLVL